MTHCEKLLAKLREKGDGWAVERLFDDEDGIFFRYKKYQMPIGASKLEAVESLFNRDPRPHLLKKALKALGKTKADLIDSPEIAYETHIVFGSRDGIEDIDVAYCTFRDDAALDLKCCRIDRDSLIAALRADGYDVARRKIDILVLVIDENGDVKRASKGSCYDAQNIIYYTHRNHRQPFDVLPISRAIGVEKLDPLDKCRAIVKCFLVNQSTLVTDSDEFAAKRREAFEKGGLREREAFVRYVMLNAQINWAGESKEWFNTMKSLVMKLCQLVLLNNGQLEYDKTRLAAKTVACMPHIDESEIEFLLSRGTRGKRGTMTSFSTLMQHFHETVERLIVEHRWDVIALDNASLPPPFTSEFFALLCKTPNTCTEQLVRAFVEFFPTLHVNSSLGALFVEQSDVGALPLHFVERHVHLEAQRSVEWTELLTFYSCGRNTGIVRPPQPPSNVAEYVEFYWHLIRGCLFELAVQRSIAFKDYAKASVGLLVAEKGVAGSQGCAPDLLFVREHVRDAADGDDDDDGDDKEEGKDTYYTVVPVEIKCLPFAFAQNGDMRRALHTATKQVQTAARLLRLDPLIRVESAMLVFVFLGSTAVEYRSSVFRV